MSEFDAVRRALDGMDVVVHMAADPRGDAPWEAVLRSNIIGAYNTYEACRLNGVKRIIYASSVMVSWGYRSDEPYKAVVEGRYDDVPGDFPIVTKESPVRPSDLYPSSKVWGEALDRYYSDVHDLSVVCLRIGWVRDPDEPHDSPRGRSVWCSQRDIAQIIERCINAPDDLCYDIFYGVSDNKYRYVDIEHARKVLGYVPQDSAEGQQT
jgi:nucleoside-diphosphate-sugar epimerase